MSQLDLAGSNFSSCSGPVTHQIVLVTDKQMLKSFSGLSTSSRISLKFYVIMIVLLRAFAISDLKCVHGKKSMAMKMDIFAPSTFLCTAMGVQYERVNMEEFYTTHRILQVLFYVLVSKHESLKEGVDFLSAEGMNAFLRLRYTFS